MRPRFWERVALDAMTDVEWEALCDGCGRCCLLRLEDVEDGAVYTTCVACAQLDLSTARCKDYARRFERVPACIQMTRERARDWEWLPTTCAYRRLALGEGLANWHPLISGDPDTVIRAGVSVVGRAISETEVDPDELDAFVID